MEAEGGLTIARGWEGWRDCGRQQGTGCLLGVMEVFRQRAGKCKGAQPCNHAQKPLGGAFVSGESGTCWWPSGQDRMLPMQGARTQPLVGELISHMPRGQNKITKYKTENLISKNKQDGE